MTINGAIMELVMLCEHPMMPDFFKPSIQKVIETISEAELVEPTDTADTPQTDLSTEEFVEGMKNLKMEVKQTDCEACELDGKADVCKICRVSSYEPQTDCGWK